MAADGAMEAPRAAETKYHDAVFAELWSECKNNPPGARFSSDLRQKLETMRPEERRALASRTRAGRAPLLLAARRGNAEAVEYLVHVCAAELEQRGAYEAAEDGSRHRVTALWCAAVAGRTAALRVLIEAGADVDAPSDSGSTALRSACFVSREESAALLLAAGADAARANHAGGTCLMNAVQSARLCARLLAAGAAADARDAAGRTALHCAAQERRLDTARLLLAHGADPGLRSHAGDDALRIAAIKGASQMTTLLVAHTACPAARADALELLGASRLLAADDVAAALHCWRHATTLRWAGGGYAGKRWAEERGVGAAGAARLRAGARRALDATREWRSPRDLARLRRGPAAPLHAQALLVTARVLGVSHHETARRFMHRGAAYADAFQYERCAELWGWALQARIAKNTILCPETCQTVMALTRLLLDMAGGRLRRPHDAPAAPCPQPRVLAALELLVREAAAARPLLALRPHCRAQEECNDQALQCIVHLLLAGLQLARDAAGRRRIAEAARRALAADVRGSGGETLLHLAVSRLAMISSAYLTEDISPPAEAVFPSAALARLLLRCGAAAAAPDRARCTPLHAAALPYNRDDEVLELLLAAGAHLDQPNKFGATALDALRYARGCGVRPLRHVSLRCLAARALAARPMPPPGAVPRELRAALLQHRPAPAPASRTHPHE